MLKYLIKDDIVLEVIEKWMNKFDVKIDKIEDDMIYSCDESCENDIESFCDWIILMINDYTYDEVEEETEEYLDNMIDITVIDGYINYIR